MIPINTKHIKGNLQDSPNKSLIPGSIHDDAATNRKIDEGELEVSPLKSETPTGEHHESTKKAEDLNDSLDAGAKHTANTHIKQMCSAEQMKVRQMPAVQDSHEHHLSSSESKSSTQKPIIAVTGTPNKRKGARMGKHSIPCEPIEQSSNENTTINDRGSTSEVNQESFNDLFKPKPPPKKPKCGDFSRPTLPERRDTTQQNIDNLFQRHNHSTNTDEQSEAPTSTDNATRNVTSTIFDDRRDLDVDIWHPADAADTEWNQLVAQGREQAAMDAMHQAALMSKSAEPTRCEHNTLAQDNQQQFALVSSCARKPLDIENWIQCCSCCKYSEPMKQGMPKCSQCGKEDCMSQYLQIPQISTDAKPEDKPAIKMNGAINRRAIAKFSDDSEAMPPTERKRKADQYLNIELLRQYRPKHRLREKQNVVDQEAEQQSQRDHHTGTDDGTENITRKPSGRGENDASHNRENENHINAAEQVQASDDKPDIDAGTRTDADVQDNKDRSRTDLKTSIAVPDPNATAKDSVETQSGKHDASSCQHIDDRPKCNNEGQTKKYKSANDEVRPHDPDQVTDDGGNLQDGNILEHPNTNKRKACSGREDDESVHDEDDHSDNAPTTPTDIATEAHESNNPAQAEDDEVKEEEDTKEVDPTLSGNHDDDPAGEESEEEVGIQANNQ